MKPAIGAIIGYVLCAAFLYAVISFTYLEPNVVAWSESQRFVLAWVPLIGAVVGFVRNIK